MSQIQNEQRTQKNKGWLNAAVIGVIVFLASVGGLFYLFVDNQTHYLTERNFRLLDLHGSLLSKRLAIQKKVFKNTINERLKEIKFNKLKDLINNRKSVECRAYESRKPSKDLAQATLTKNNKNPSDKDLEIFYKILYRELCREYIPQASIELHIPESLDISKESKNGFSLSNAKFSIDSQAQGGNSRFKLGFHLDNSKPDDPKSDNPKLDDPKPDNPKPDNPKPADSKPDNQKPGGIDVFFPVNVLMEQLELGVEQHIFDDLLLADENGQILYQKDSSVFQYDSVVSLLLDRDLESFLPESKDDKKSGDSNCEKNDLFGNHDSNPLICSLPASRDIEIADLHYKVFAQSVTFPGTKASKAILIGLIEAGKFRSQTFAISPVYLVFLLFLGMGLVFALPFLKLWTMGPQDRLTIVDVLSLFFSCLIGTAFLVFFLLYSHVSGKEQEQLEAQLNTIADDINKTFHAELGAVLDQVNALPVGDDLKKLEVHEDYKKEWPKIKDILLKKDKAIFNFPFFKQVSWIAEDGQQKIKWSTTNDVTELVPVSNRSYFQHVQKANRLNDPELLLMKYVNEERPKPIYFWLEPILSMTTGRFMPVVSKSVGKNSNHSVVSITPDLISLQQVTLPPGFGFAVVHSGQNQDFPLGQVLFHSEDKRNLRENFLKVTDENARLFSLIRFGHAGKAEGRYWGEAHTFYARPLKSTPWALVVFVNNEVLWTPMHQTLIQACVLFGLYAFFVIVLFFLGILVFRSIWHENGTWLWPQPLLARSYRWALGWNLGLMGFWGFILSQAEEGSVWSSSLFTASAILPIFGIISLVGFVQKKDTSQKEKKDQQKGKDRRHEQVTGRSDPMPSDKWDYLHLMMSLLILLSIMPALGFFHLSYEVGGRQFRQDLQKAYQERIFERVELIVDKYGDDLSLVSAESNEKKFFKDIIDTSAVKFRSQSDKQSLWSCVYLPQKSPKPQSLPDWYVQLRILLGFSPGDQVTSSWKKFGSIEQVKKFCPDSKFEPWDEKGFINNPTPLDKQLFGIPIIGLLTFLVLRWVCFSFFPTLGDRTLMYFRICAIAGMGILGVYILRMIYSEPRVLEQLLISYSRWILLIFVLVALLFLLPRFIVRRIFLLDIETPIRWKGDNLSHLLDSTDQLEFPGMLVVGPPGSGKSTAFEKASEQGVHTINLRELGKNSGHTFFKLLWGAIKQPQNLVIMLDHFEYARGMQEYDKQKLELLEELLKRNKRVCVISDVHPLDKEYFLRSKDDDLSEATNNTPCFVNRWMQMFQMFVTLPFSGTSREDVLSTAKEGTTHLKKFEILWRRTRNGGSLIGSDPVSLEGYVEGVRSLARSYYESMWASCTNDEKLSLYHLAVDRFLHSHNPNFRGLYEKGLIEIRPQLQFMDESFRQFVLAVGEKDHIAELEISGPGSVWSMMHRPLIVGLVVIGVFLVMTQESIKSDFLAFVGLLPVALPALLKFFSVFRQTNSSN